MKNIKKGFTMVEMAIVLSIIGILASISYPKLASHEESARETGLLADFRSFQIAGHGVLLAEGKEYDGKSLTKKLNNYLDSELQFNDEKISNKKDPWNTNYRVDFKNGKIIFTSAGRDKIFDSSDDRIIYGRYLEDEGIVFDRTSDKEELNSGDSGKEPEVSKDNETEKESEKESEKETEKETEKESEKESESESEGESEKESESESEPEEEKSYDYGFEKDSGGNYIISGELDLATLAYVVNNGIRDEDGVLFADKDYVVTKNINLNKFTPGSVNKVAVGTPNETEVYYPNGWVPIGINGYSFNGIFTSGKKNGKEIHIHGLSIDTDNGYNTKDGVYNYPQQTGDYYAGLLGNTTGEINNIRIVGKVHIDDEDDISGKCDTLYVGTLVAKANDVESCKIHTMNNGANNIDVDIDDPNITLYCGGLIGKANKVVSLDPDKVQVINSFTVESEGISYVGGIAGEAESISSFQLTINQSDIELDGEAYIGGLVGKAKNVYNVIVNNSLEAEFEGDKVSFGGVVGEAHVVESVASGGKITLSLENEQNDGEYYIGGIVGNVSNTLSKCVNDATIKLTMDDDDYSDNDVLNGDVYFGGVAGKTGYETYAIFSDGDVYADLVQSLQNDDTYNVYVGGLVGYNTGKLHDARVEICYLEVTDECLDKNIMTDLYVGGLVGYNTGNISACSQYIGAITSVDFTSYNTKSNLYLATLCGYNAGNMESVLLANTPYKANTTGNVKVYTNKVTNGTPFGKKLYTDLDGYNYLSFLLNGYSVSGSNIANDNIINLKTTTPTWDEFDTTYWHIEGNPWYIYKWVYDADA